MVLDHSHQAVVLADRRGGIQLLNAEGAELARRMTGRAPKPGQSLFDLAEDLAATLRPAFERALAGESIEVERELVLGSEEWRWYSFHLHGIPGGAKKARYVLIWARDITDRRRSEILQQAAESRQKESEELYRLLAENSSDMISRLTPEGMYSYVSPSCTTLLGWLPEELLGRSAYDLYHPDDLEAIRRSHATVKERPVTSTATYRVRRKDGSYTWFETSNKEIVGPEGLREIIANSRDVSARREVEEERDRIFTYSVDLLDRKSVV